MSQPFSHSSNQSPANPGARRRYAALPSVYLSNPFQAVPITTEAMIRRGLPSFQISGLSPAREIADRIRSALHATGGKNIAGGANIQVNLAPVDLRKTGAYLDLSIAVSILEASAAGSSRGPRLRLADTDVAPDAKSDLDARSGPTVYLGELALDGRLRPVPRLPALLRESRRLGFRQAILPFAQIPEAALIPGIRCIGIEFLGELLAGTASSEINAGTASSEINAGTASSEISAGTASSEISAGTASSEIDAGTARKPAPLQTRNARNPNDAVSGKLQIKGVAPPPSPLLERLQLDPRAHRALAIAAAGWHSMLLIGPPGTGKSSLARSLAALLAPPDQAECLEILIGGEELPAARAGVLEIMRPVRAPHHSCTRPAMVGGGHPVQAGEITRAHSGVLLLDELAEFSRDTLQALREPMENGYIDLSRGREHARFPARFLLVATTNPCPCGRHRVGKCSCGPAEIRGYINRILGPLRDRVELEVRVEGANDQDEHISENDLRHSIEQARRAQDERLRGSVARANGEIPAAELERLTPLKLKAAQEEWNDFVESRRHSHRSLAGLRRVARTIADLEGSPEIRATDLQEALYYRCLDRYWS